MSFLARVTTGKFLLPIFGILYGTEGIGKTTFGAQLPKVIFLGPETANLFDVARLPKPMSWEEILSQLAELGSVAHPYSSLCIDSLDWCENLLLKFICEREKVNSLQEIPWGGGPGMLLGEWMNLINACLYLRETKKMNVLMLAHFQVKSFNDPLTALPYDRYSMKMHEKSSALFREAVDFVFFATNKNYSNSTQKKATKGKGYGGDVRIVYTEKRATHDAKNRFSLPLELPLDFNEIMAKVGSADIDKIKVISKEIEDIIMDIQDVAFKHLADQSYQKVKNSFQGLELLKNRINTRLNQQGENSDGTNNRTNKNLQETQPA